MSIGRQMDKKVVVHIQNEIFSSVQSLSCVWLFATPSIATRQASLSITNPRSLLNSCPSSRWCHPAISSSVIPFSSCPHPSQHQGLFPWVNSSHEVAEVLELKCYSAIKKNAFESALRRWMKLEPIIQSEVCQKEKHQYSVLMHTTWNLKRW